VITVVAGKPGEFAFELSKSSKLHAGTFTFKVTDRGQGFHTFKVCAKPVKTAAANACTGKVTKTVHPGQTVTLTVTITKAGKYEVLCSLPGHAAAGMKGLIGVGVAVKPFPVPPPNTGTTGTTTTTGPLEPNGCPAGTPPGTTIGSDEDGDEGGANPDDGDGCL
jgi:plastocyanin